MPASMPPSATAATASSAKPTRNTSPRAAARLPEVFYHGLVGVLRRLMVRSASLRVSNHEIVISPAAILRDARKERAPQSLTHNSQDGRVLALLSYAGR